MDWNKFKAFAVFVDANFYIFGESHWTNIDLKLSGWLWIPRKSNQACLLAVLYKFLRFWRDKRDGNWLARQNLSISIDPIPYVNELKIAAHRISIKNSVFCVEKLSHWQIWRWKKKLRSIESCWRNSPNIGRRVSESQKWSSKFAKILKVIFPLIFVTRWLEAID